MTTKIFRVQIQSFFRKTGMLRFVEGMRYYQRSLKFRKSNKIFFKENPDFVLPPPRLAFDAYNAPKWKFYKQSGEGTAKFIKKLTEKHFDRTQPVFSVYEWGCGPGRVIRHLPQMFSETVKVYGSDYNKETIDWCKKNFNTINFSLNELEPPLQFPDHSFDFIYCISVFTHLSAETGMKWANELYRVLKPQGILLITTLGENSYKTELLPEEKRKYLNEGIVVRGQYKEGKKMFLTFHNPKFIQNILLKNFIVMEHFLDNFPFIPEQEWWVAKKIQ